jgi:hypothetical protein
MRLSVSPHLFSIAILSTFAFSCAATPPGESAIPPGMHEVKPVATKPASSGAAAPARELSVARGQFFSYALPEGWHVGEDGQFALSLVAPDSKAFTVMVGNAGSAPNYPPDRFVYEKLMALQPQNLRVGNPRRAAPVAGFAQAYEFDVEYTVRGVAMRGIAKCHVAPAYDSATLAMTAALSEVNQWPGYAAWLPLVADQISAANGAAFGMRGIMAQNLNNSTAYAEAARQYRDWSQRNWQQVTNDRNASQDRNNVAFREYLGAVQTYVNPYDARVPLELPTTYKYFWIEAQGTVLGTDDPSVNPNNGSTKEWKQMSRRQP